MEQIMKYIKPELVVVAVVLYFIGMWIKQGQLIKDKYIPLVNGAVGIVLCAIYVLAATTFGNTQEFALVVFTALTQGILVAGLSTYVDQIIKQINKDE
jgi:hypothetical protein